MPTFTESVDDLFSFGPVDYSIYSTPPISPDNKGFDMSDTNGQSWGSWFQGILGTAITSRFNQSDKASGKVTTVPNSGVSYVEGKPVSTNYSSMIKPALIVGGIVLAGYITLKMVK